MEKREDGIACETCQNQLWVCESHEGQPMDHVIDGVRCGGAGMPCQDCNDGLRRGDGFDYVLCSVDGKPGLKGYVQ